MIKLNDLFDYQRFARHEGVGSMIDETNRRYGLPGSLGTELSDDDLMINAAGELNISEENPLKKP